MICSKQIPILLEFPRVPRQVYRIFDEDLTKKKFILCDKRLHGLCIEEHPIPYLGHSLIEKRVRIWLPTVVPEDSVIRDAADLIGSPNILLYSRIRNAENDPTKCLREKMSNWLQTRPYSPSDNEITLNICGISAGENYSEGESD